MARSAVRRDDRAEAVLCEHLFVAALGSSKEDFRHRQIERVTGSPPTNGRLPTIRPSAHEAKTLL